ncbi:hypothetical protein DMENIID0001_105700 [Sergentomyia squamirostris]
MEEWAVCRLCLESREEELKSIMDCNFDETPYYDIFFTIVGINLMDYSAVPTKICSLCEDEMIKAFEFRRKCLETEEKLKDLKNPEITGTKTIEFVSALDGVKSGKIEVTKIEKVKLQSLEESVEHEEESEYLQEIDLDEVTKDENLRIRCKSCKVFFDGMDVFKSHICGKPKIESVENEEGGARNEPFFKCYKCSKTFIGRSYFMAHLDQHAERKIRHRCTYCNMEFSSTVARTSHIHREHLKTPSCHCPFCGKGFYDKNRRTNHIRDKHTNPSVYQCDRCGKELNSSISLNSHMKQHTDEVTCEICGRKLKNQRTFEHHMALHTSEKKFTCSVCSGHVAFRTNPQLRKHMQTAHPNEMIYDTGTSTAVKFMQSA